MARAYLAVNRGPGRFHKLAVVKQILPELSKDPSFVAMFLDEARLAAQLHHPNIVQTFDVAEHDGNYLLAMEYLDGLSLTNIYRRIHPRLLPLETHLWVLTQVLTGLHYAHTLCDYDGSPLGVVHRDINPANVLVTYDGDVKVLDFGVAKVRGALAVGTESRIKGKPSYCAPEQLRGAEPDARADVFAVGVMLWEVVAGRRLNRAATLIEAAKVRLSGREPKIREVRPDVDPMLADICDRAMAMEPRDRFTTAAELRMELESYLGSRESHGRRTLVERMAEVFAGERLELRGLIERSLAEAPAMARPVAVPPSAQAPTAAARRGLSRWARIAAPAAAGAAVLALAMTLLPRGKAAPPSPTAAPAPTPTPIVVAPVAAQAPAKTEPAAAPAPPPAPTPAWEEPQAARKAVKARPLARAVQPARANARRSGTKVSIARAAEGSPAPRPTPMQPRPADLAVVPSATAKPAPDDASSPATPGTHLVRPARAIRGTVDERDPYSP